MSKDRSELNDLSKQHPETAQRLEADWLAWAAPVNAEVPGQPSEKR